MEKDIKILYILVIVVAIITMLTALDSMRANNRITNTEEVMIQIFDTEQHISDERFESIQSAFDDLWNTTLTLDVSLWKSRIDQCVYNAYGVCAYIENTRGFPYEIEENRTLINAKDCWLYGVDKCQGGILNETI